MQIIIKVDTDAQNEIEKLNKQNNHLHTQTLRYENMLSKMNKEYEKVLNKSNENEMLAINLKRELSNLKITSNYNINSLDSQLKVKCLLYFVRKPKERLS